MFRRAVLSLGACLLLCPPVWSQVKLEHKFTPGASYKAERTTKLAQKLTINGSEVDTSSESRSVTKNSVGMRDAEGKLRVKEAVEAMQVTMTVMGMTYQFDSANPDQKGAGPLEGIREVHKALLKRSTTVIYDKFDSAVGVESDVDIVAGLAPEIKPLVEAQLTVAATKDEANSALALLPTDAVKPGDTWTRTKTEQLGAGQIMTTDSVYTYQGTVDRGGKQLDKITGKVTKVDYGLANSTLPFTVKDVDLKPAETEMVIHFDRQAGRVVDADSKIRITGDMKFVVNDMELPVKLDLRIENGAVVKEE